MTKKHRQNMVIYQENAKIATPQSQTDILVKLTEVLSELQKPKTTNVNNNYINVDKLEPLIEEANALWPTRTPEISEAEIITCQVIGAILSGKH